MSWVIYDFSHMFICLLWFCHGLPKGEIVRTYVIHLLRTYVTILCNWLILWQNAFYLYLGRSRMCLILQETMFKDQVLKHSSLFKKSSKECNFIKARQLVDSFSTPSICRGLRNKQKFWYVFLESVNVSLGLLFS